MEIQAKDIKAFARKVLSVLEKQVLDSNSDLERLAKTKTKVKIGQKGEYVGFSRYKTSSEKDYTLCISYYRKEEGFEILEIHVNKNLNYSKIILRARPLISGYENVCPNVDRFRNNGQVKKLESSDINSLLEELIILSQLKEIKIN